MKYNIRLKYLVMPLSIMICISVNYSNAMDKNDSNKINMFISEDSYGERIANIMGVITSVNNYEQYLTVKQNKNFNMLIDKLTNSSKNKIALNNKQVKALEELERICYSNPIFMNNCIIV